MSKFIAVLLLFILLLAPVAAQDAVVNVVENADFGEILVNSAGLTLYVFANDEPDVSNCVDQCLNSWTPLTVDSEDALAGAPAGVGAFARDDGAFHVTFSQQPLYTFVLDSAPGDTNGDGAGGVWSVAQFFDVSMDPDAVSGDFDVFFANVTDNAVIPPAFAFQMRADGLTVEPAGVMGEGVGHFHSLVNQPFVTPGEIIPSDDTHIHFGDASETAALDIAPGTYTLRLQFGDGLHTALAGGSFLDEVVVTVAEDAPAKAVRFVTPTDGATVPPTFSVLLAATGIRIEPAGLIEDDAGHFHLLVDTDFIAPGEVIPEDEQHIHMADGSLSREITLTPGEHTLRIQAGNGAHFAQEGEAYRDEITVNVVEGAPAQQVMFTSPADGATVPATFALTWGAVGLIVEPAGAVIREDGSGGHLHVIVDGEDVPGGEVIPSSETSLHFGGAQLATELTLSPGEHTLQLLMGNGAHFAFEGPQYRDTITVIVEE